MEKKVIINVTSLQRNEAGKDEKITLETPGIYGFLQEQVYRIGEKNHSLYETPMGTMDIYVVTREIEDSIEAGKGRMRLSYDVELKGLFNHLNEIIVEVREDPEDSWKSEKN